MARSLRLLLLAAFAPLVAAAPSLVAQNVTIVDSTTIDLQAFVNAAAPGDTLLLRQVRPAPGLEVVIDKPLRILGDRDGTGGTVGIAGGFVIDDVDSGEVVLQNLVVLPLFVTHLRVLDCAAPVWIADVNGGLNVGVVDSPSVTLANAALGGGTVNAASSVPPQHGLHAVRSRITMTDSRITGANGGLASPARAGAFVDQSDVHAVRCTFRGGTVLGSTGGPGARVLPTGTLIARGCTFEGGLNGPTLTIDPGARFDDVPGPVHVLGMPPSLREGQRISYGLSGPAGHFVALAFTFAPSIVDAPFSDDLLAVGPAPDVVPIGILPPGGATTIPTTPVPLLPGVDSATFFVQVLALDPNAAAAYSGSARAITLIDDAF